MAGRQRGAGTRNEEFARLAPAASARPRQAIGRRPLAAAQEEEEEGQGLGRKEKPRGREAREQGRAGAARRASFLPAPGASRDLRWSRWRALPDWFAEKLQRLAARPCPAFSNLPPEKRGLAGRRVKFPCCLILVGSRGFLSFVKRCFPSRGGCGELLFSLPVVAFGSWKQRAGGGGGGSFWRRRPSSEDAPRTKLQPVSPREPGGNRESRRWGFRDAAGEQHGGDDALLVAMGLQGNWGSPLSPSAMP